MHLQRGCDGHFQGDWSWILLSPLPPIAINSLAVEKELLQRLNRI